MWHDIEIISANHYSDTNDDQIDHIEWLNQKIQRPTFSLYVQEQIVHAAVVCKITLLQYFVKTLEIDLDESTLKTHANYAQLLKSSIEKHPQVQLPYAPIIQSGDINKTNDNSVVEQT